MGAAFQGASCSLLTRKQGLRDALVWAVVFPAETPSTSGSCTNPGALLPPCAVTSAPFSTLQRSHLPASRVRKIPCPCCRKPPTYYYRSLLFLPVITLRFWNPRLAHCSERQHREFGSRCTHEERDFSSEWLASTPVKLLRALSSPE